MPEYGEPRRTVRVPDELWDEAGKVLGPRERSAVMVAALREAVRAAADRP